ncbi:MAG: hypothetical protein PUG10_00610 [Lachnospiraceae bacterium]|nr:hypothetical protein [Lachnospiraceae bacterium]
MNDRTPRKSRAMYYVDGSAVRKMDNYGQPARRRDPQRRPADRPRTNQRQKQNRQISAKADRALAFNLKYTVFVVASVLIMVGACVLMLYMESKIKLQQNNINNLEAELESITDDNAACRMTLENMYSLNEIYDVATNELGMVYAKKGQIIYYNSADEDYVKQYQDVPEAE